MQALGLPIQQVDAGRVCQIECQKVVRIGFSL